MNCLRSLERWDHGFESHSKHWCLYCVHFFCVCVVLCVGSGLATGWSPVQVVRLTVYRIKKLKKRRGVQTGPTRYVGHWMAYCTCPGWLWWWRIWWNEDWQGKPKYSEKTFPSATSSTTNPTWPDPGSNPGRSGEKPATNRLSYGAAKAQQRAAEP
jgi:hypothetical protein